MLTMNRLLEQYVFVPSRLASEKASQAEKTLCSPVQAAGSERKLQMGLPLFCKRPVGKSMSAQWNDLCGLLKEFGVLVQCDVHALESVSAAQVPLRIAERQNGTPLHVDEVQTADLITLRTRGSLGVWAWPAEIEGDDPAQLLPELIAALRGCTGGNTPVGISLPAGVDRVDLANAVAAQADYLVLESAENDVGELTLWSLATARRLADEMHHGYMPILLDAPAQNSGDILKLLALGASFVCADAWLATHVPSPEKTPEKRSSGHLASLGLDKPKQEDVTTPLRNAIERFRNELTSRLQMNGCQSVEEMHFAGIRSVTDLASSICGVPKLA